MADDDGTPLTLHPNGTATLRVSGRTIKLRRPKWRDLVELSEALEDLSDETRASIDRDTRWMADAGIRETYLRAVLQGIEDPGDFAGQEPTDDPEGELAELRRESRRRSRARVNADRSGRVGWLRDVVDRLRSTGPELPEDGELDAFLTSAELPARLIAHWQTVPFDSGG